MTHFRFKFVLEGFVYGMVLTTLPNLWYFLTHYKYVQMTTQFKPYFTTYLGRHEPLPTATCIEDKDGDNIMIADPKGSYIFSKGGLNYMVAGEGADKFFFSLCSTKPRDDYTSVIENFNPVEDKIFFFCTKKSIREEDVRVIIQPNLTTVEVQDTAIVLIGAYDLTESIILNTKWSDVISHSICE